MNTCLKDFILRLLLDAVRLNNWTEWAHLSLFFFFSFHSEKRKFAKGHKVELDEPLNGACCQIAFSAVVFKVKNISVQADLNTKATSVRIYSAMATWQAQPLMILLKVKCFFLRVAGERILKHSTYWHYNHCSRSYNMPCDTYSCQVNAVESVIIVCPQLWAQLK